MKTTVFLLLSLLAMLAGPISSLPAPKQPGTAQEEEADVHMLPDGLPFEVEKGGVVKRQIDNCVCVCVCVCVCAYMHADVSRFVCTQ